jgi:hypothetical protein
MKKILLLAALVVASAARVEAQASAAPATAAGKETAAKPEKTPADRAGKDADWAEQKLGLSADQKTKWRDASLQRITANEPLREKMKASADKTEKRSLGMQMRDNSKKFEDTVSGVLTADQKTKWEQARQEKKEARKGRMKGHSAQPPQAAPQD